MTVVHSSPNMLARMWRTLSSRAAKRAAMRAATQTLSAEEIARIEALLIEYQEANETANALRRRAEKAKARLKHVAPGVYGSMEMERGKPHERFDQTAGRKRLADLGEPIPTFTVAGALKVKRIR